MWLRRNEHEVRHPWRVIRSNGFVADGFVAAAPGMPRDATGARERLRQEGVRIGYNGRAFAEQRFRPEDWSEHPAAPLRELPRLMGERDGGVKRAAVRLEVMGASSHRRRQ